MLGWEWIGWRKPPQGWKKLNVDGSLNVVILNVGAGGALRNENGDWEDGFTARLGSSKIEEAESWALLQGLKMARENGARRLIIELDSLAVYRWIRGLEEINNSLTNVIQECKDYINKDRLISIKHVYREGNQVAEWMAKLALNSPNSIIARWKKPPKEPSPSGYVRYKDAKKGVISVCLLLG